MRVKITNKISWPRSKYQQDLICFPCREQTQQQRWRSKMRLFVVAILYGFGWYSISGCSVLTVVSSCCVWSHDDRLCSRVFSWIMKCFTFLMVWGLLSILIEKSVLLRHLLFPALSRFKRFSSFGLLSLAPYLIIIISSGFDSWFTKKIHSHNFC